MAPPAGEFDHNQWLISGAWSSLEVIAMILIDLRLQTRKYSDKNTQIHHIQRPSSGIWSSLEAIIGNMIEIFHNQKQFDQQHSNPTRYLVSLSIPDPIQFWKLLGSG